MALHQLHRRPSRLERFRDDSFRDHVLSSTAFPERGVSRVIFDNPSDGLKPCSRKTSTMSQNVTESHSFARCNLSHQAPCSYVIDLRLVISAPRERDELPACSEVTSRPGGDQHRVSDLATRWLARSYRSRRSRACAGLLSRGRCTTRPCSKRDDRSQRELRTKFRVANE
jgi:hypothetical protein